MSRVAVRIWVRGEQLVERERIELLGPDDDGALVTGSGHRGGRFALPRERDGRLDGGPNLTGPAIDEVPATARLSAPLKTGKHAFAARVRDRDTDEAAADPVSATILVNTPPAPVGNLQPVEALVSGVLRFTFAASGDLG